MTLSSAKRSALCEIIRDAGQVFFASAFIGPLLSGERNWIFLSAGVALSLCAWLLSLWLMKE